MRRTSIEARIESPTYTVETAPRSTPVITGVGAPISTSLRLFPPLSAYFFERFVLHDLKITEDGDEIPSLTSHPKILKLFRVARTATARSKRASSGGTNVWLVREPILKDNL